jgi:hypothetical protein
MGLAFVASWCFVLGCLLTLGVAGWPIVALFRCQMNWSPLVAPLAGALVVPLATLAFYTVANVTFIHAALISLSALVLAAAAALVVERPRIDRGTLIFAILVVLAITSVVTWVVLKLSIEAGEPALQYFVGTDHLGYAHAADWLVNHPARHLPRADPKVPYESFPQLLFSFDPRFGSQAYLGLISLITAERGTFSYDRACAVWLAAAVLGVSAGFARTRIGLLVLAAGLLVSEWYDYGRIGFFGKALAYPGMMLVIAFALAMLRSPSALRAPFLMLVTAGAAIDLSGGVCAFLLLLVGVPLVLTRFAYNVSKDRLVATRELMHGGAWLAVTVITAAVSMGTLARPLPFGYPDFQVGWDYVLPRAFDIEHQGPALLSFNAYVVALFNGLSVLLTFFVAVVALRRQASEAFALAAASLACAVVAWIANAPAVMLQMIGLLYPLSLCATVALAESSATPLSDIRHAERLGKLALPLGCMLMAVLMLGMRVPRLFAAVSYYAGARTPPVHIYKRSDIERIANAIASKTAAVDIGFTQAPLLLLVELAPRGIELQWTTRGWRAILGYRPWDPPTYDKESQIRIVSLVEDPAPKGEIILKTNQYALIREIPSR